MKTTLSAIAATILAATPAFAGNNATDEIGLLGILFLGFGALIITFQLIPAIMLLGSMMKGVFAAISSKSAPSNVGK